MGKAQRIKKRDERFALYQGLAEKGEYDTLTNPVNTDNARPLDKDYKYIPTSIGFRLLRAFLQGLLFVVGRLLIIIGHGARIKGREHIKAIGGRRQGAFTVSNHVLYLDNLFVRSAMRPHRAFYTAAPHNMKKGIGGAVLRAAGVLPIPENIAALKNFNGTIGQQLKKGNFIHVYAEQSMWNYYEKPRPLKRGAFHLASKFDAPVIPCFMVFREGGWFWRLFRVYKPATFIICPAIWPDKTLNTKQNAERFQRLTEQAFAKVYEEHYGANCNGVY